MCVPATLVYYLQARPEPVQVKQVPNATSFPCSARKYKTRVKMPNSHKISDSLQYKIKYGRKLFYSKGLSSAQFILWKFSFVTMRHLFCIATLTNENYIWWKTFIQWWSVSAWDIFHIQHNRVGRRQQRRESVRDRVGRKGLWHGS